VVARLFMFICGQYSVDQVAYIGKIGWSVVKNTGRRNCVLFWGTIPEFMWSDWGKLRKLLGKAVSWPIRMVSRQEYW